MIIKNADLLFGNTFQKADMQIEDGQIIAIGENLGVGEDYAGYRVIPGLFDIHTHGAVGYDFNSGSVEDMEKILNFYLKNGVTSVLPTIMTDDDLVIKRQLARVALLANQYPMIKGIHLEGPFISEAYKGAQPLEYLQPLKISKFQEYQTAAKGLIKYITIAPELPGVEEFVKYLVSVGVRVSLGHSGASFDEASVAVKSGSISFTHTMNAMKPIHQHYPSILSAAWYYDQCYNEIIMDGIHVHPEMVAFMRKIKTDDKIIGITDSLMPAGLGDGHYFLGPTPIVVKGGDCKIKGTDIRAGSTLVAFDGYKNYQKFTGASSAQASKVWSYNPAKMLGLNHLGKIEKGFVADLIFIQKEKVIKVMEQGAFINE